MGTYRIVAVGLLYSLLAACNTVQPSDRDVFGTQARPAGPLRGSAGAARPIERNLRPSGNIGARFMAVPVTALKISKKARQVEIDRRSYALEALTVTPPGSGPFPLAVISHGNPLNAEGRRRTNLRQLLPVAEEFARRGYLSIVFARRGFARSGGPYAEDRGVCHGITTETYTRVAREAAKDYAAVIAEATGDLRVDTTAVVAVGVSGGGFAVTALASDPPKGLVAIVNFSGGRGAYRDHDNCDAEALAQAFEMFGRTASVPALWLYSETDRKFWPQLVAANFSAYTGAGGAARLHMFGPLWYWPDGHELFFPGGREFWRPALNVFLADVGAATWVRDPGDPEMPRYPPPDRLTKAGRGQWLRYLGAPGHKAFAVGPASQFYWSGAHDSVEGAATWATARCEAQGTPCRVVSVDGAAPE